MSTENPTYPELIRAMAVKMGVMPVHDELLYQYPQFVRWPGSHNQLLHHHELGGLARHTWEIIDVGMHIIPQLNLCDKIDPRAYYLAALFHDTGKMFDYDVDKNDKVTSTEHKRLIYHLPRSCLIWHDIIGKFSELNDIYHDGVLHCILAHHGSREFGSPVAPKTREAWLLHLCDGISARMDDCERLDVVKAKDHSKI
jgi:3'-5' exoribonuclease